MNAIQLLLLLVLWNFVTIELVEKLNWTNTCINIMNSFKVGSSRIRSFRNFKSGLFVCQQCNKCYTYKTSLQRHLRIECGKEPKYSCEFCGHKTKHKSNFVAHLLTHKTVK